MIGSAAIRAALLAGAVTLAACQYLPEGFVPVEVDCGRTDPATCEKAVAEARRTVEVLEPGKTIRRIEILGPGAFTVEFTDGTKMGVTP